MDPCCNLVTILVCSDSGLRIVGLQTVGRFEEEHVLGFGVGVRSWSYFFREREREREVLDRSIDPRKRKQQSLNPSQHKGTGGRRYRRRSRNESVWVGQVLFPFHFIICKRMQTSIFWFLLQSFHLCY